jgi:hypothetical protein
MIQSVPLDFGQKFRVLLAYSSARRNLKNAQKRLLPANHAEVA